MAKASENIFPKVRMSTTVSSAAPSGGEWRLESRANGIYAVSSNTGSAGTGPFGAGGAGAVATDVIWDAAGDLVQGTGADTAAKLTAGTAGNFLKSAGAAAANLWAFPPGHELDYVEFTAAVNVTATVEASGNTIVAGTSKTYAAEAVIVEFFSHDVSAHSTADAYLIISLWDGATELGNIAIVQNPTGATAVAPKFPVLARRRLTPSAGTHQYIIKGHTSGGQPGVVQAGAGGVATRLPGYIRVTKV